MTNSWKESDSRLSGTSVAESLLRDECFNTIPLYALERRICGAAKTNAR